MTCGRVWWPILGICALHLTHPCTHTVVNTHTHREHTPRAVGNHIAAAPVEQLEVWCLAQGSHLSRGIVGGRERCTFTPPTNNRCQTWDLNPQPSENKSHFFFLHFFIQWRKQASICKYPLHIKKLFVALQYDKYNWLERSGLLVK